VGTKKLSKEKKGFSRILEKERKADLEKNLPGKKKQMARRKLGYRFWD